MKLTNLLDAGAFRLTNLAPATAANDAVTKAQLDAASLGYSWKQLVRAASTANLTLSGTQTIDGVSLIVGDRILVKNQTSAQDNGIYVVAAETWTRSADTDTAAKVLGASVSVSEGTTQGNSVWLMTTDAPITLGTTALVWAQINAGTATYTAGVGINITNSVIAIDTAVVARKASATIGDGTATTYTVTHNLNTQDVLVSVREVSGNSGVLVDWVANGVNTLQLTFGIAPTSGQYRVTVMG